MNTWPLDEAKTNLGNLIRDAREQGPQVISVQGEQEAVVLSIEEYRRLREPRRSMLRFLQESPLADPDLDLERRDEMGREVEL
ncbi:MAG: type II toxin-antitoxin system Phd/YefM family antitoxin [Burkholderiales bacterium]|nr:type II toxin-antitoxin system Phd/YefM family antitoxin [Burkholderiales bacterium]